MTSAPNFDQALGQIRQAAQHLRDETRRANTLQRVVEETRDKLTAQTDAFSLARADARAAKKRIKALETALKRLETQAAADRAAAAKARKALAAAEGRIQRLTADLRAADATNHQARLTNAQLTAQLQAKAPKRPRLTTEELIEETTFLLEQNLNPLEIATQLGTTLDAMAQRFTRAHQPHLAHRFNVAANAERAAARIILKTPQDPARTVQLKGTAA